MRALISLFAIVALTDVDANAKLPNPNDVYFSILAGGGGTRLWPLSRDHKPKQFMDLRDSSLIEASVRRLASYPEFSQTRIVLATASNLVDPMNHLVHKMALANEVHVIADPSRRDTGPAILLNILEALKKSADATVVFLPADPYIPEAQSSEFVSSLRAAIEFVESNPRKIALLGKTPTFPATGFGYIQTGASGDGSVNTVLSFKEKPDLATAEGFLKAQTYLWNMGIFVAKAKFFADLFKQFAPGIFGPVSKYVESANLDDYNKADKVSVDIAVMQPASQNQALVVVPVSFDWDDVGDVKTYLEIQNEYLAIQGRKPLMFEFEAKDNQVLTRDGKLVTIVGENGLCVIDTDDALLIIKCTNAQKVKNVVESLQKKPELKSFVE